LLFDLPIDIIAMRTNIRPGVHQVFGSEGRIVKKKLSLRDSKAPGLLQNPDRYPRADNAGIAPLDTRTAFNADRCSCIVPSDSLE
jgi:hypothetical protein